MARRALDIYIYIYIYIHITKLLYHETKRISLLRGAHFGRDVGNCYKKVAYWKPCTTWGEKAVSV